MPVRLTPASSVVTGPRLRGTAPRARIPRAARAFRRVIEVSRAALIDEHSPRRIHPAHRPAPLRARVLVALGGAQALCFNGRPARRRRPPGVRSAPGAGGRPAIASDIDASDTGSPPATTNAVTWLTSVA